MGALRAEFRGLIWGSWGLSSYLRFLKAEFGVLRAEFRGLVLGVLRADFGVPRAEF